MIRIAVMGASVVAATVALVAGFGGTTTIDTASARLPQAGTLVGDPVRGKKVYLQAGCGACHTFAAAGSKGTLGPNLDKALRGRSATFVRQSIVSPNAGIAKGYRANVMPKTYGRTLTKRQLDDLVAFLIKRRS